MIISMKSELVKWFDIDLEIAWLWVQALENLYQTLIFDIFGFGLNLKSWGTS